MTTAVLCALLFAPPAQISVPNRARCQVEVADGDLAFCKGDYARALRHYDRASLIEPACITSLLARDGLFAERYACCCFIDVTEGMSGQGSLEHYTRLAERVEHGLRLLGDHGSPRAVLMRMQALRLRVLIDDAQARLFSPLEKRGGQ